MGDAVVSLNYLETRLREWIARQNQSGLECLRNVEFLSPEGEAVRAPLCVYLHGKPPERDPRGRLLVAPEWMACALDDSHTPFTVVDTLNRCRAAGVRELWVLSSARRRLWVGLNREKGWEAQARQQACMESRLLKGFSVRLDELFPS